MSEWAEQPQRRRRRQATDLELRFRPITNHELPDFDPAPADKNPPLVDDTTAPKEPS